MGTLMTTFSTPDPIAVTVDIPVRSDITVIASDRTDTVVDVVPRSASRGLDQRAAEHVSLDHADGRLTVRMLQWRLSSWFTDGGAVDVTVQVPIGCSVELRSGMGDLRCQGEFASADLKTGMGTIRVDHCGPIQAKTGTGDLVVERVTGRAQLVSSSGTVRVGEVEGDAVIKNGNGESVIGEVTGDLQVNAANGAIVIARAGDAVTAKSANGSIRVDEVSRGHVDLHAAYGSVVVGVREDTAAWLDLSTKYGHVYNELTAAPDPGTAASTAQVRVQNAYADITIRRSEAAAETRTNR
jgi:DUF4097 and DUF4098 domain-containing protein YvlB